MLSSDRIKVVDGVTCGNTATKPGQVRWLAGSLLESGYFISHVEHSVNFAKKAEAARRKLQRVKWRKRNKRQQLKKDRARYRRLGGSFRRKARDERKTCWEFTQVPQTELRFDLSEAAGLALRASGSAARSAQAGSSDATSGSSNMEVVEPDGDIRDAAAEGSAVISKFLIAPNGKVYVLFSQRALVRDGSGEAVWCLLAEVDPEGGIPICIDSSLSSVWWQGESKNPPIQFDSAGALYYSGYSNGKTVLRKYLNGVIGDLVTDYVNISDFLVLPDGTVFLSGSTSSTGAQWLRRLSPSGGLENLRSNMSRFLRFFPDGNVYMGLSTGSEFGVKRFLTSSGAIESKYWITGSSTGDAYNSTDAFCTSPPPERQGFCGNLGSSIKGTFVTPDGKLFALAGYGSDSTLAQYYPSLAFPETIVKRLLVAASAGTSVVFSGMGSAEKNITTVYNTSNGAETQVIGPDNEIEVFHLHYVADGNKVLFDGLRFSDNRYVLGQIDLDTNEVTFPTTSSTRWEDFQTFG